MTRKQGKTPKPLSREESGRRGGKARTPAKRQAARRNGKRGAEHGKRGGRPPKDRHLEDFTDLGPPPDHPLRLAAWFARAIGIDAWRHLTGRGDDKISHQIKSAASALSKVMPMDVVAEAVKLIEKERGLQQKDSAGPQTVRAETLDGPKKSIGI